MAGYNQSRIRIKQVTIKERNNETTRFAMLFRAVSRGALFCYGDYVYAWTERRVAVPRAESEVMTAGKRSVSPRVTGKERPLVLSMISACPSRHIMMVNEPCGLAIGVRVSDVSRLRRRVSKY